MIFVKNQNYKLYRIIKYTSRRQHISCFLFWKGQSCKKKEKEKIIYKKLIFLNLSPLSIPTEIQNLPYCICIHNAMEVLGTVDIITSGYINGKIGHHWIEVLSPFSETWYNYEKY